MSAFDAEVTVTRQRFANRETGFAVLDAEQDGEPIVLVGPLIHLEARERARVLGSWVTDSRYGPQVKVSEARPLAPVDAAALITYLRKVKHVGRKRAEALLERHGQAHVLEAIDRDPVGTFQGAGLSAGRAAEAAAAWQELRLTRQLHLLLAPHGLGYLVRPIHAEYGPSAQRVIQENPYELTRVFGVGFLTADRIARSQHGDISAIPGRPRAAVVHLLAEAERNGSTCLPLRLLTEQAQELLGHPLAEADLSDLLRAGDIIFEADPDGETFVYRTATAELEAELAERVRGLVGSPGRLSGTTPSLADTGIALTDEQAAAVAAAFAHRLSVITGGPGTGKTATVRAIATAVTAAGAKVLLVAPTGRAAARMREASGLEASTVHSALGWIPGEGPEHDEDDPVRADLLLLDESSMANLELMVTLLRAISQRAHVVLVGDADQLAPVGAGKPFAEMLSSGVVPSTQLSHIFRQAAGSMIVQGAHAIRRGEMPSFQAGVGTDGEPMRRDLFLIERNDPRAAREEIVSLVAERLPAHYGVDPVADIQVFAPVYRGELGIDALNTALRERLNPHGPPVGGGRLRLGDKLMMTGRNLHELRLMNGTLLRLVDEIPGGSGGDGDEAALLLTGDDGTVFRLAPEEAESLRLAYACSVHRGQGIELPVAVIVAHPAAGAFLLRREMLYTAVTRARIATVIVGVGAVVARAAATPDGGRRHSRLAARLTARLA
ncbi:AAA family ATPase [Conexibacter sp. DBS9H8]|uniref:SF1B family DNA helicase RecD2 n=1 Tax=Conexibacter sp. DBS9H8 TaxID=2937801 RepID=UPI00200DE440|nr:AAA family ATPase [Conexibacter sp. DBS9H8]